jgi:hypothetical protein|tara:strand:+ start:274 stop:528 length:255 start_codon:yes stop_codon:yes gene_type:complete
MNKRYLITLTEKAAEKTNELLEYGAKKSGLLNELLLKWLEEKGWIYDEKNDEMIKKESEDIKITKKTIGEHNYKKYIDNNKNKN